MNLTFKGFIGRGERCDCRGLFVGASVGKTRSIVHWGGEVVVFRMVRSWRRRRYRVILVGLRG